MKKLNIHILIPLLLITIAIVSVWRTTTVLMAKKVQPVSTTQKSQRIFTKEELSQYDGSGKHQQILLAYEGDVYDITSGSEFYAPEKPYHFLAGSDATAMLRIAGGSIVKKKYPIIGKLLL